MNSPSDCEVVLIWCGFNCNIDDRHDDIAIPGNWMPNSILSKKSEFTSDEDVDDFRNVSQYRVSQNKVVSKTSHGKHKLINTSIVSALLLLGGKAGFDGLK